MTSLARRLARPEILDLPPVDLSANANAVYAPDAVRLDANENPYPPLVDGSLAEGVNRYPDPQPAALKQTMAALYGVAPTNLVVTRGADDAIDILMRTFCRPGEDAVLLCAPSFTAYEHYARVQGARIEEFVLGPDFAFDADAFVERARAVERLKLAFLCSPNNPTGHVIDPADVLRVAEALAETILILDEAYIEFADVASLAGEAAKRDNLVVLRTLSKAFGLAGARVGCAIGEAELIELIGRALPHYPVSSLAERAALAALSPSRRPIQAERVVRLKAERARMAAALAASPDIERVREGGGNFLFLEVKNPEKLAAELQGLGLRLRFRPHAAPGGVRLSIGTEEENRLALSAFGVDPGDVPGRRAEIVRDTKETRIAVAVALDTPSPRRIDTGIEFFDHMLDQVAAHGGFSLTLACDGDLGIDAHHSLEDCALAFGAALAQALGDKRGIGRFGFALPMDETEAQVLIDLSGRPYSVFEGEFEASHIGQYPTQMTPHIFRSIADTLRAAIHVKVTGENDHHKTEACFKAFGRALRQAIAAGGDGAAPPSTKGVL